MHAHSHTHTHTHTECHVSMKAELGQSVHKSRNSKMVSKPPEAKKDRAADQILSHSLRGNQPCPLLDLGLLPPEPGDDTFLFLESSSLLGFVISVGVY